MYVLYCTLLYFTVQYCTVLYSNLFLLTLLYGTVYVFSSSRVQCPKKIFNSVAGIYLAWTACDPRSPLCFPSRSWTTSPAFAPTPSFLLLPYFPPLTLLLIKGQSSIPSPKLPTQSPLHPLPCPLHSPLYCSTALSTMHSGLWIVAAYGK